MKTQLVEINDDNIKEIIKLKVSKDQTQYIASNEDSIKDAKENADVARPFAIYHDGKAVGFTMFAFDEEYEDENDRYWLWRFMIDEKLQGKGIGSTALKAIIEYFKENGANNIRLSTKQSNTNALNLYRKAGFKDTGEEIDGEIVLQLEL